jgi:hypothetical protein
MILSLIGKQKIKNQKIKKIKKIHLNREKKQIENRSNN